MDVALKSSSIEVLAEAEVVVMPDQIVASNAIKLYSTCKTARSAAEV
jgi:hypothetical protein